MNQARFASDSSLPARPSRVLQSRLFLAGLLGALAQVILVCADRVPLGIPSEWDWQRVPAPNGLFGPLLLTLLTLLPAAACYLALCHWGERRIGHGNRWSTLLWLLALSFGGMGWLWFLIDSNPDEIHRLGRGPIVQYYHAFSGYFLEAREADDFPVWLSRYEEKMAEGDVLHIGTHPPGLILAHRGLLELCRASPRLTAALLATRPLSVRTIQEQIILPFPLRQGPPLDNADLAALWGSTLLTLLGACLTILPLYLLLTRTTDAITAWRTACFWPLVPALAIFVPVSDTFLPLLGTAIVAAWWPGNSPRGWRIPLAAVLFWIGMLISLAMLTVGCLLLLLTLLEVHRAPSDTRPRLIVRTIGETALAGSIVAALTALFWLMSDVNLLNVWSWNYHNHAGFYLEYDRTYWKWLLINPLEFALAIGLPLIMASAVGFRLIAWKSIPPLAVFACLGLLWLTGKNSGEAARLWIFLIPWVFWTIAPLWRDPHARSPWLALLIVQLITATVVATRVSGFEFQRFLA